ncbi:putative Zinc finger protein 622 [Hypsibius exemplaris]|uniref:Zinc finger protein 622 n=1 Tax=Hypsibius exemplaris TaxID=2072580 RepID=A0A1W0WYC3_HYPEX|nr:putative Zinc finger protein 622 [Hypsibius exemplaris]
MAASSAYSCGTCRVKFPTLDMMQIHYKCDWHRYNLKRKVAELPPVSAENFADILKAYQSDPSKKGAVGEADPQSDSLYCKACAKSFLNAGSYASHMESKKHLDRERDYEPTEKAVGEATAPTEKKPSAIKKATIVVEAGDVKMADDADDWEDEDESDIPPYDVSVCLFCSKKTQSLESSLSHMSTAHSFFLPDFDYCTDPAGLIDYLGKKVTDGNMCLYCNQRFQETTAAQRHMESKGHTKMGYEGEFLLEYEDFYDFTSANENDAATEKDPNDEAYDLDGTGYEMTLPSGAVIGHRELSRFYKQSLRPVKDVALVSRVVGHYKALGWKSDEQGMGYARNMLNQLNRAKKDQYKKRLSLGMQTNKIKMEHYRRAYGF